MKKFFATLIVLCFMIGSNNVVYALTPTNLETGVRYEGAFVSEVQDVIEVNFDDIANFLRYHAEFHFKMTGEKIVWAICSLDKHRSLQFYIFYNKNAEAYQELINQIDEHVDFIQFGSIWEIDKLDNTREAFEEDKIRAALNTIVPIGNDSEKSYETIKKYNIPIYWSVKESNDLGIFTLDVAIGKYVINLGDSLSKIALRNHTTIGRLLENNSNISNPDVIFAGDYLVIK